MHQREMSTTSPGPGEALAWAEIYARLRHDRQDPSAWDALWQRVQACAWREFGSRGRDVVDDTTAITCASILSALDKARGAESFSGFVYGHYLNARRRVLGEIREMDQTRPIDVGIEDTLPSPEPDRDPSLVQVAALRAYLALLPARERRAVELRHFENASSAQIAAELGVTEGNAKRIVFNGLLRLRRYLCPPLPGD